MTIAETIDSFTPSMQETLKSNLRNEMGCHEPDCHLTLQIAAGSLSVTSILTIPDSSPTSGVNASTLVASVEAAATQLVAQPPAALSASLGVPVESTAPVAMQTGVVVPLVVAPPPPSLPPPPLFPPPVERAEDAGVSLGVLAGAIGGGVGLLAVAALLAYLFLPGYRMKAHEVDATHAGGIVFRDSVVPSPPPESQSVSARATDINI